MIIPVQNGIVPGMTLHYVLRSMRISLAHQNESMDVILPPSATNAPLGFFRGKRDGYLKKKEH